MQIVRTDATPLIQKKMGVFCWTPVITQKNQYVSSCDDGEVRIFDKQGKFVRKFKIDTDPTITTTQIAAIPSSSPQLFVGIR